MQSDLVAKEKEHIHRIFTILIVQRTHQDECVFKCLFSVFNKKELLEGKIILFGILDVDNEEEGRAR